MSDPKSSGTAPSVQKQMPGLLSELRTANNRMLATSNELDSAIFRVSGKVPPHEPSPSPMSTPGSDKPDAPPPFTHEMMNLLETMNCHLRRYGALVEALAQVI